jgi:large subunit ribosomal protein L23
MEILVKPIITEKMTAQAEKLNRYGFVVAKEANKIEIKAVNTQQYVGKVKTRNTTRGVAVGRVNRNKKAIITLKQGEVIDFYASI